MSTNHPGSLFKWRFWSSRSGTGLEIPHVCQAQVPSMLLVPRPLRWQGCVSIVVISLPIGPETFLLVLCLPAPRKYLISSWQSTNIYRMNESEPFFLWKMGRAPLSDLDEKHPKVCPTLPSWKETCKEKIWKSSSTTRAHHSAHIHFLFVEMTDAKRKKISWWD